MAGSSAFLNVVLVESTRALNAESQAERDEFRDSVKT